MNHLAYTFPTPEQNLACDEALLELCEEQNADELLRVWEPQQYFVVLGSSNRVQEEVFVERCEADGVPILRRHSGGGTVLQGAGCLNYSLILKIQPDAHTRNITETTNFIMQRHAEALTNLLGERIEMKGSSDLTIAGKKFSGNAQRRKLNALLFHGTFLLNFKLDLIERYLKLPPKQPAYREHRRHSEFVRNIGIDSSMLKEELKRVWNATTEFSMVPLERIEQLVQEKYARNEWNLKL